MKLRVSLDQVQQLSSDQQEHLARLLKKRGLPLLYTADNKPYPQSLQINAAMLHSILAEFEPAHDDTEYEERTYVDAMWEKLKNYL